MLWRGRAAPLQRVFRQLLQSISSCVSASALAYLCHAGWAGDKALSDTLPKASATCCDVRCGGEQRVGSSLWRGLQLHRYGAAAHADTAEPTSNAVRRCKRGCYDVLVGHGAGTC
jgi:hypothetical protein